MVIVAVKCVCDISDVAHYSLPPSGAYPQLSCRVGWWINRSLSACDDGVAARGVETNDRQRIEVTMTRCEMRDDFYRDGVNACVAAMMESALGSLPRVRETVGV